MSGEKDLGNQLEGSAKQEMGGLQEMVLDLKKQLKEALDQVANLKNENGKLREQLNMYEEESYKLFKENNHLKEKFDVLKRLFTLWEPSASQASQSTDGSDWTATLHDDPELTTSLLSMARRISQGSQRPSTSKTPDSNENASRQWEGSLPMEATTSTGGAEKRRSIVDVLDLSTIEYSSIQRRGQNENSAVHKSADQLLTPGSKSCEPSHSTPPTTEELMSTRSESTLGCLNLSELSALTLMTDAEDEHQFSNEIFFNLAKCYSCKQILKYNTMGVRCTKCGKTAHLVCRIFLPPCASDAAGSAGSAAERNIMPSLCYPMPQSRNRADMLMLADVVSKTPPMVPPLLKHCFNEIERRGKIVRELYKVQVPEYKLIEIKRRILKKVGTPYLGTDNIHVVCGCVIYFLSSLSEPIIPSTQWEKFVRCVASEDVEAITHLLSNLPQPNRDTVTLLVTHIVKVSEYTTIDINLDDLAAIFAPYIVGHGTNPADVSKSISVMKLICSQKLSLWKNLSKPKKDKLPTGKGK